MINFNEEISKYKPVLDMNDVESSIKNDEILDIMDLLQYIAKNFSKSDSKE